MKKLRTNKNDFSFNNKHKFKDLVDKIKALGYSVIKNGKQTCILGIMIGFVAFSSNNIYKYGKGSLSLYNYNKILNQANDDATNHNDKIINELNDVAIFVSNVNYTAETKYYFENNNLFDQEGNLITLEDVDKPIYFVRCNINDEILQNINLSQSKTKTLCLDMSSVDDNFVNYLPESLELLYLNRCNYITNLNGLAERCPNIKGISINSANSLSDLSFIYNLPNLKEVYISDSAYITEELLLYLNEEGIITNLTISDLSNSRKVDQIVNEIITPEMNDKEKIQAVALYVLNNLEYDINQLIESNDEPLKKALDDGKGVCISYAYLTTVLLNKAGLNSYQIAGGGHAWNLINLDDEYYYLDTTQMDGSSFYNFLLRTLNLSKHYMVSPNNVILSSMLKPEDEKTIIPLSLINDINSGLSEKDITDLYQDKVTVVAIVVANILSGIGTMYGFKALENIIIMAPDLYYDIKFDYYDRYIDYKCSSLKK